MAIAVAAAGALFTAGLMIAVSEPGAVDAGGWPVLLAFCLFAVSPYLALVLVARRIRQRAAGWAALVTALLITVPAAALYVLGFYIDTDAQSGLLFIFIPLYQILTACAAALVSAIVLRLTGRGARPVR